MSLWRLARTLFWIAGLIGLWVGIIYLPSDAQGLPTAFQAWESLVVPYRELALIIFSGALLAWVLWREFVPQVRPWLQERWPSLFPPPGRISVVDFARIAKRHGWKLGNDNLDSLDLVDGLRQAAVDGDVSFEGRIDVSASERHYGRMTSPLVPVSAGHFANMWIEVPGFFEGTDNFDVRLYYPGGNQPDVDARDLHLSDVSRAMLWLRTKARAWKGRHQKAEDAMEAARAANRSSQSTRDTEGKTLP